MELFFSGDLKNDDQARRLIKSLLLIAVASTSASSLLVAALNQRWGVVMWVAGWAMVLLTLTQLVRAASLRHVTWICFIGLLGLCFVSSLESGGIRSASYFSSISIVYAAALMFGVGGAVIASLGAASVGAALVLLEVSGRLPQLPAQSTWQVGVGSVVTIAMAAFAGAWMHHQFRAAMRAREAERHDFERTAALLETEVKLRSHAQKELSRSYDAALEGTRVKTAFLANMSHELRTPMNAVVGLTDLMLRDQLNPAHRDYLETVRESSNGLLVLLDDLLDLSKIEAGAMRLDRVAFSPRDVMAQLERLLTPKAVAKHIELRFHAGPDLPDTLLGDPLRLTQVLTNLIGNSLKFTDRGEVRVTLRWHVPALSIEVTDSGIGMTAEQCSALFVAFTQVDPSATRRFGGTGLGLAIVKRLCELHQGEVTVASELGQGSTFTATLRYDADQPRTAGAMTPRAGVKPAKPLEGLRVLIAEDNRVNQKVAERLLERLGVVCLVVNNGAEALAQLKTTPWDVVLMDIQMPVMDGIEATRLIREQLISQPTIIALSANAMDEDKTSAKAAGVNDFLSKPITLDALADALHRARPL